MRPLALIVSAIITASGAARSQAPATWPDPVMLRPAVSAIIITADTVWFCATLPNTGTRTAFAFARQARQWMHPASSGPCPISGKDPDLTDSIALGNGVVATTIHSPDDEGRSIIRLRDSARGRTLDLKPKLDRARIQQYLPPQFQFSHDTLSATVSSGVVTDSLIWLGLAGGFQEGDGELGGIIRVDRATGTPEWIVNPQLAPNHVAALVATGNWLWAGVVTTSDDADAMQHTGLARLDRRTGAWKTYTDSTSPLTSPTISHLSTGGRAIAMATEMGLSVIELRDAQTASPVDDAIALWNSSFFVPAFSGDSMVFDLAPTRQLDAKMEAAYAVAQRFGLRGRERPLHTALLELPTDALQSVAYNDVDDEMGWASYNWSVVPDTAATDVFVQLLRTGSIGAELAGEGIKALGRRATPQVIDELRLTFAGLDTARDRSDVANRRSFLGAALAATGDTTATQWALATLDQGVRATAPGAIASGDREANLQAAIDIIKTSRDPRGMSLLLAVTPITPASNRTPIVDALVAYDTPQAWATVVAYARLNLLPRDMVLPRLQPSALTDSIVAMRVRELIREELAGTKNGAYAAYAAHKLRLIELVPDLIANLPRNVGRMGSADPFYEALIRLTGRADAPVYKGAFPAAAANWWNAWSIENAGKMTAVSAKDGEAAFYQWQKRRSESREP